MSHKRQLVAFYVIFFFLLLMCFHICQDVIKKDMNIMRV